MMKGIVLAGGTGSRLWPITLAISKQLMPVYDKPMIYYPLSVLMLAGIREILIITTPQDKGAFERLLGDGSQLGCNFSYAMQEKPEGLAQAFLIGKDFIGDDSVALVLGDNIFYGSGFTTLIRGFGNIKGAGIFAHEVSNPQRYGVIELNAQQQAVSLEEKPENPRSNYAIPGLYFYDNTVVAKAKNLKASSRGELEITDINRAYLLENKLQVAVMNRGIAWLDTGTCESLNDASEFVRVIEKRQGQKIGCLEEVAWRMNFITADGLEKLADKMAGSSYGSYLHQLK